MTGPFADRLFRITFALAGIYNLAFGLWAAVWPLAFFHLFEIAPPRYQNIWACLGMVVGVYGLLYWYAAWKLEAGWPIIAVGLLGKVVGPIGMAMSFSEEWPLRLGMLCLYNDLIWWLPFGLFLIRGTRLARAAEKLAPWICVATHAAAIAMLGTYLRHGTLMVSDAAERGLYVGEHRMAWAVGWSLWMLAAASLVGFYAWWGSRLAAQKIAIAAVILTALGMVFDFSGEGSAILRMTEQVPMANSASSSASVSGWNPGAFTRIERCFTLCSAGAANGLYTVAGIMLTLVTPKLPRWIRWTMWGTWVAGTIMTVAAVFNHLGGMFASTAVLFSLLLIWIAWMGLRWRPA